jgi:ubiquinone/menaquinone biosynthesis C-methylase UbiE
MTVTDKERETRDSYNVKPDEWLARSGGADRPCFWNSELFRFKELIGKGYPLVLEIGAGPATDGKYIQRQSLRCVSSDNALGMMQLARKLKTNRRLATLDMKEMPFIDNSFDGFWATACLLHLEDPAIALKEIARVCKSGAIGFISVKEVGGGVSYETKYGYHFFYVTDKEFSQVLAGNGMEIIDKGRKPLTPDHDFLTYLIRLNK